jgi:hypothetical protein
MALMLFASMVFRPCVLAAPADTDAIFPPRITIVPDGITIPPPVTIRTLIIARSCAAAVLANVTATTTTSSILPMAGIVMDVARPRTRIYGKNKNEKTKQRGTRQRTEIDCPPSFSGAAGRRRRPPRAARAVSSASNWSAPPRCPPFVSVFPVPPC